MSEPSANSVRETGVIVAIATSAGGLKALSALLAALPADFPAPVLVVQHLDPHHRSLLSEILTRRIALPVHEAVEGEPLLPCVVYIAPPDHHLLVTPEHTVSLTRSELVHFVRPSADLLFESVAATYRTQAIAVVLTGTGYDGAMGISAVKKMGGVTIAQSQASAEFSGMPDAAVKTGDIDAILPLEAIAPRLQELTGRTHQ